MKDLIKKILKEDQMELDLFGGEEEKSYERCSHFEANPQHRKLCHDLNSLGPFLYKDLGLKNIINEKIYCYRKPYRTFTFTKTT